MHSLGCRCEKHSGPGPDPGSNLHPVVCAKLNGDCCAAPAMISDSESAWSVAAFRFARGALLRQNSSPFFSIPWMPFSPFTVCVTWKSTASEQN